MKLDSPRAPDLVASTKARSLLNLGDDVLILIMEELQATSPHSVSCLALVHSSCARLARGCRFRNIDFDHSAAACERLRAIKDKQLLTAVRVLTIRGTLSWDESHDWTLIGQVLPGMTGLREIIIISNDVPSAIIDTIEKLPKARLHLSARPNSQEECLYLERFMDGAQLYSFDLQVITSSGNMWRAATKATKVLLLSCPNIRVLKVDIHMGPSCFFGRLLPPGYLGCGFREGESPPPLEVLELIQYPFGRKSRDQGWTGPAGNGQSEKEYWARTFDWSKLRRLKTANASFAAAMMPHLSALKDFELVDLLLNPCEAFKEVHDIVPTGLEHISVPHLDCVGLENIVRHGSHLTSLYLHDPSVSGYEGPKDEESVDQSSLRAISQGCPNLQALHIDLARRGDWPYAIFDVIACMPRIRTLSLYCELEDFSIDAPSDGLMHPLVTFASSTSIYEYLRDHRPPTSTQPALQELYVISGWPRGPPQGRVGPEYWFARDNCATFKCAPSERDDDAARGVFVTSCLDLDASMNRALQDALETSKALGKRLRSLPNSEQRYGKIPGASRSYETATKRVRDLARRHISPEVGRRVRIAWEGPYPQDPEVVQIEKQCLLNDMEDM